MQLLFSGQARALVIDDNDTLTLHRLDDRVHERIDHATAKLIFDGCNDVKSIEAETQADIDEAMEVAFDNWLATRVTINLAIILTACSDVPKPKGFPANEKTIEHAFQEVGLFLARNRVFELVCTHIYLQYAFFKQNQGVVDAFRQVRTKSQGLNIKGRAEGVDSFNQLAYWIERSSIGMDVLKDAVSLTTANERRPSELFRFLNRSDQVSQLVWGVCNELVMAANHGRIAKPFVSAELTREQALGGLEARIDGAPAQQRQYGAFVRYFDSLASRALLSAHAAPRYQLEHKDDMPIVELVKVGKVPGFDPFTEVSPSPRTPAPTPVGTPTPSYARNYQNTAG